MTTIHMIAARLAAVAAWCGRARPRLLAVQRRLADSDVQVFELEGLVRGRVAARVLYAGRSALVPAVRMFLFSGPVSVRPLGGSSVLRLRRHLEEHRAGGGVDVLLWEAWPWETSDVHGGSFVVQPWLDACADPGRNFDAFLVQHASETVARTLRRAHQLNVVFEVTTNRAVTEQFYREMVVPTARERFGRDCIVQDLSTFLSPWSGASHALLLLREDGVLVAGQTLVSCPGLHEMVATTCGELAAVRDDKTRNRQVTALVLEWVFREACRRGMRVNLAATRPFLDDGVLQFKRQWGCHFRASAAFPRFRLQFISRAAPDILAAAPFLHLARDGVRGEFLFSPQPNQDPARELDLRLKPAVFDGLKGITVHVRGPGALASQLQRDLAHVKGCSMSYVSVLGPDPDAPRSHQSRLDRFMEQGL